MKTDIQEIDVNGVKYVRKDSIKKVDIPQGDESNPFFEIGKSYFIRTVTHYFTGILIWVGDKELCLENVAWIADTGRFNEFMAEKTVSEVEPFPDGQRVIIGRGSIIDMSERSIITSVK
jgi:hypothetical protein